MSAHTFGQWILLFIISDMFAALLGAWHLIRNRGRTYAIMDYLALLFLGLALDRFCSLIATSYRPVGVHYPVLYVTWIFSGNTVRSLSIWLFVLFLIGFRGNHK